MNGIKFDINYELDTISNIELAISQFKCEFPNVQPVCCFVPSDSYRKLSDEQYLIGSTKIREWEGTYIIVRG